METYWIERDASGNIKGLYANRQDGYAETTLPANDPAVVAFLNPPPPPVTSVTPRQARLALLGAGLLDQVNTLLNTAGGVDLITWEYASVINRSDPMITNLAASLGLTSAQIDALFTGAATL